MFRNTKLALIAALFSLSLTACLADETDTIDPTSDRITDELEPQGDDDTSTDDQGCRLRRTDGELDCPTE